MITQSAILAIVLAIISHWTIQTLAALILIDVCTGVAAAWKSDEFDLRRLADFLANNILPYLLVYASLRLGALALAPEWALLTEAVWAIIVATLVGSIASNVRETFGRDLPVPGFHGEDG